MPLIRPWGCLEAHHGRSETIDVDDCLRERFGRLLRQVVADAAFDEPVPIGSVKFARYAPGSGWGAPLASPSIVIVGTGVPGASASRASRSWYVDLRRNGRIASG